MTELANALRAARRARLDQALAEQSTRLETALGPSEPEQRFILERLLAYAEAAARLARLVGVEKKPVG